MIAFLDADIVAYRCAASAENDPQDIAEIRVNDLIQRILYETNSESYLGFLSGSNNFRYEIYPEYKANRKGKPKPKHLEACREHLVKQWQCKITDGIEADDALGIEHQAEPESVLCSIDKDLLQLPGQHYNFVKQEFSTISPLQGLRNFYTQLLEGDASDNIPAFDGKLRTTRPKFVQKLIDELYGMVDEKDMYCYVESLYGSKNLEQMILNANLLYIQQKEGDTWRNPIMTHSGVQEDSEPSFELLSEVPQDDGLLSTSV
jgi:hypothetical protein